MSGLYEPLSGRSKGADQLDFLRAKCGDLDRRALLSSLLFDGFSTQDQERLLAGMYVKECSRGDLLYMEGEAVQEVMRVGSGLVKITKLGASGAAVILRLAAHGAVLGAADLFATGKYTTTAEAMRSGLILACRASSFKPMVESRPALLLRLLQAQAECLRELEERFHEMATDCVRPRVARQLIRLHETMAQQDSDQVEIHLSHEELAQMTGTNLYTIGRLFAEWEGIAVSSRRGVVSIRDVQLLREIYESSGKREV
jgi:CRP/FNR family transcriptional regulator